MSSPGITSAPDDNWLYPESHADIPKMSPKNSVFLGLFETPEGDSEVNVANEERNRFLVEIRDDEFEEAIEHLIASASDLNSAEDPEEGLRQMERRFAPLVRECEGLYTYLSNEIGNRAIDSIEDSEVDRAIDGYGNQDPELEMFLGGLKKLTKKAIKAASKAAKKGVAVAGALGLGPVIQQLKGVVKPLIQQVLKVAIEKLPPELQEPASQLAVQFGGGLVAPTKRPADTVASDSSAVQTEYEQRVCAILFSPDEPDQEYEVQDARRQAEASLDDRLIGIDSARERCIARLSKLQQHEDPEPAMEEFFALILPALKLAISVVGRPKVIKLLAKLIAPILGKLVKPTLAAPLSTAIASTGLGVMGLEMAEAITNTVEDVAQRLSRVPDYAFANPDLLGELATQAVIQASASHIGLPPNAISKLAGVAKEYPEYYETGIGLGVWEALPAKGPRRYKRFRASRPLRRVITPYQLRGISTFGGASLAEAIEDQFDVEPGEQIEVELQLYEAIPGTRIAECVRHEQRIGRIRGPVSAVGAQTQLHPLDERAAELLTGESGFGRNIPAAPDNPRRLVVGQRLFHIAPVSRKPVLGSRAPGRIQTLRESSRIRLLIDFPRSTVRLQAYLSERKAQRLASAFRPAASGDSGEALSVLRHLIAHRLAAVAEQSATAPLAIIHTSLSPTEAATKVREALPPGLLKAFLLAIEAWVINCATAQFKAQSQRLIEATAAPEDGVTLDFALTAVPGLDTLGAALQGLPTKSTANNAFSGEPSVALTIRSGRAFDK